MQTRNHAVGSRIVMIVLAIILLTAVVLLVGTSLNQETQDLDLERRGDDGSPSIPVNEGALEDSTEFIIDLNASDVPTDGRDLAEYYDRRAYQGAPPTVPHPVESESLGGNSCLQCHATGDYVPKYDAYTPIVPHPELLSCNQCHVPVNTTDLFTESDWQTLGEPTLGETVLLGSPPPIPHTLQLREDCLSCHAGPAAPVELRFDHPERINCVQCHVAIETEEEWER